MQCKFPCCPSPSHCLRSCGSRARPCSGAGGGAAATPGCRSQAADGTPEEAGLSAAPAWARAPTMQPAAFGVLGSNQLRADRTTIEVQVQVLAWVRASTNGLPPTPRIGLLPTAPRPIRPLPFRGLFTLQVGGWEQGAARHRRTPASRHLVQLGTRERQHASERWRGRLWRLPAQSHPHPLPTLWRSPGPALARQPGVLGTHNAKALLQATLQGQQHRQRRVSSRDAPPH